MFRQCIKYFLILIIFSNQLLLAQYYSFGRNKVQYSEFDWKILKTKHFDIYYYDDFYELAEIGAEYAEQAFDEYKVKFNSYITRRIPLIFYNTSLHFQQTNTLPGLIPDAVGGFFEFAKGRVVIPSTGSLKDFRHVIRHELTHVFMKNKLFHIKSDHRQSTGKFPPLWFVEGLAEFNSTKVDAQAEMLIRDAVMNNFFVGLQNLYKISGTFLMYKEGQNFLEFVKVKYGEDKVFLMMDNIWMYKKFTNVIEYTLGKSIEKIDVEWILYLKKKYYPLYATKDQFDAVGKRITNWGFNFSPVPYNKDGITYLYFVANRNGYSSLYKIKLTKKGEDQAEPELVLRGEKSDKFETFHLFRSSIDVSKDGILAFVSKSGGTDVIYLYSINDDEIINKFKTKSLISIASPKFSRDGAMLTFQAIDSKGYRDIYVFNLSNNNLERITNDYYNDHDPIFGMNNNQIIFSSDRTGGKYKEKNNIFSIDISTKEIKYLTYLNGQCNSPILSNDFKKLFFTSDLDGVNNIYSVEFKNGKTSSIVQKETNYLTSVFTPRQISGSKITFTVFNKFAFNLFTKEIEKVQPDSNTTIVMNFDSTGAKWSANIYTATSKKGNIKYEKHYSLDFAQSQISTSPVFGTQGGAVISLSDLLGNDKYYFLLYNTASVQSEFLNSFNLSLQRVDLTRRTNYGYGIFHFTGNRYDIRDSDEFFFERSFGGFFQLNFPLSKFSRIETSVTVANSDKEIIRGALARKALLVSNSISYVYDNSLWGPSGPLDGTRTRLQLAYTGDVKFSNVNYYTIIADFRNYFRLGLRSAFAIRAAFFYNDGQEARRFFMGGSWDLRGWPRFSIRGEKMWLTSAEFRFPLLDQINLKFPFMNLGFFGIRGAAFFDAGSAWDTNYKSTLGSVGVGIRFNLFGALVLRYDIGKKIEDNFTRFQDGLFYQFFFGWDF